jgi:probable DNA repair protein
MAFNDAVREFEGLVRNISFEPHSVPAPITIIDAQAVDGLHFDAMWVTGMDETRWPPAPAPDAFIPMALQVRAGMPNATAALAREHAYKQFQKLQGIARAAIFSWARTDQDVEVLPSAWLREIDRAAKEPVRHETYAERVYSAKPTLEIHSEFNAPALTIQRARGGTRIFELQSQCPFRAFVELRLDAQPLDEVGPNVDARERGTLIHAALADVWQSLSGSAELHAKSTDELEVLVRTALARHAAKLQDGASLHRVRLLQIEQDISAERILKLLQLDKERTPFQVVGRPETQEQASIGPLKFELRLDRMDELLDDIHRGERVILDYKTSNKTIGQSWTSERPEQPQLPLYAVTHQQSLAAVSFVTLGAKGVGYQGIACDQGVLPGVKAFDSKKSLPSFVSWEALLAHWEAVITRLANEFSRGQAQVDPLPNACRYCHLSTVCRVSEQAEAGLAALQDDQDPE